MERAQSQPFPLACFCIFIWHQFRALGDSDHISRIAVNLDRVVRIQATRRFFEHFL